MPRGPSLTGTSLSICIVWTTTWCTGITGQSTTLTSYFRKQTWVHCPLFGQAIALRTFDSILQFCSLTTQIVQLFIAIITSTDFGMQLGFAVLLILNFIIGDKVKDIAGTIFRKFYVLWLTSFRDKQLGPYWYRLTCRTWQWQHWHWQVAERFV